MFSYFMCAICLWILMGNKYQSTVVKSSLEIRYWLIYPPLLGLFLKVCNLVDYVFWYLPVSTRAIESNGYKDQVLLKIHCKNLKCFSPWKSIIVYTESHTFSTWRVIWNIFKWNYFAYCLKKESTSLHEVLGYVWWSKNFIPENNKKNLKNSLQIRKV